MKNTKYDYNNDRVVSVYDECPIWSSIFGNVMLQNLPLRNAVTIVDLGCGTGYPTFDIAERVASTTKVYGIDHWDTAIKRAQTKKRIIQSR